MAFSFAKLSSIGLRSDDATTGITLIEAIDGDLRSVTADAAYDTVGFYADRFLMVRRLEVDGRQSPIHVVLNFFEELKARVEQ